MLGASYSPPWSVVRFREVPRSTSRTVTVAPAIAPPFESVIVPRIPPALPCEKTGAQFKIANAIMREKTAAASFHVPENNTPRFIGTTLLGLSCSRSKWRTAHPYEVLTLPGPTARQGFATICHPCRNEKNQTTRYFGL